MRLLHITAHLGGGVGKVLSRLVEASHLQGDGIAHAIACLEAPEKSGFVEHARRHGATVICAPDDAALDRLVRAADIVQLAWWHHPVAMRWMCSAALPPMRMIVWSHISGLSIPALLPGFVRLPHRFLFSSPCSLDNPALRELTPSERTRLDVVFSSGGFDDLPQPPARGDDTPLRVGYLGTLNFAKLHPDILDFVAAVRTPGFRLELVGDPVTAGPLISRAQAMGIGDRIALRGYTDDIAGTLAGFDVLAYLLNPLHYGTTENALLEAMAMGVVPIVLDNPAEKILVTHAHNGLVVRTPCGFAEAIARLEHAPELRRRLSANAAADVRDRFSLANTAQALDAHYRAVMLEDKRPFDFRPVFGQTPSDWFRSCQGSERWRFGDSSSPRPTHGPGMPPHQLLERTKGSVFHYRDVFPGDAQLNRWAQALARRS
jgi:glycosyltransferase involved in cell wall biosynthesis